MAQMMSPEEIQKVFDTYNKALADRVPITAELEKAMKDAKAGVKDYTDMLSSSLNQLGTSVKSTFMDVKDGKKGAGVFNNALNSGADVVANVAMEFGPLGIALGVLIKVLTFAITAVTEQSDALYKANEDLGKIGGNAGGMTQIYSNLKEFGYGVGELGDMTALITQNSVTMSNFSGTVSQGTKKLAEVAKGIQSSDLQAQFMNMGYSVNDMNTGIANYMGQQAYFYTSQKKTTEQLRIGAADYLKNIATLSKLTGQSEADMAKQRDEALAIDSFNAALEGMDEKDRERQLERYNALAKIDKDAAIGYANQVSGFVGLGKQSQQLLMTTGGVSNRLAKDSKLPLDQFMQSMADAEQSTHALRKSDALLGGSGTFLAYGKTQKLANQANGAVIKAMQEATEQTNAQAEGLDKTTASATRMRQSQMSARDAFQDLLQMGILPVMEGIETLADWVDNITHLGMSSSRQKTKKEREGLQAAEGAKGTGIAKDQAAKATDISSKLQERGFSDVEAAAITGNLHAESSFNTGAINLASGASGLMQWTGARKDALKAYAKEKGKEWTDEGTQLDFIRKELKDDNGYEAQQFKKAMEAGQGDPAKAAYYFAKYVERPHAAELAGSAAKRANMAVATFSKKPLPADGNKPPEADKAKPTDVTKKEEAPPVAPTDRKTTDVNNAQNNVPKVAGPSKPTENKTGNESSGKTTVDVGVVRGFLQQLTGAQQAKNSAEKQIAVNK